MIKIFQEDSFYDSNVYQEYTDIVNIKSEYYMTLGYSKEISYAIQDYNEKDCGVIYARDDDALVGFLMYNRKSIDRLIFDVCTCYCESPAVYEQLYEHAENLAKSLGCIYLNETVVVKDQIRIDNLESLGFKKEFCLMYKRV